MLLTESDARKRLCPQALANAGYATHRGDMHCVASDCMAWCWAPRGAPVLVPANAEAPADKNLVKRGQITTSCAGETHVYDEYVLGFIGAGATEPAVYGRCGLAKAEG